LKSLCNNQSHRVFFSFDSLHRHRKPSGPFFPPTAVAPVSSQHILSPCVSLFLCQSTTGASLYDAESVPPPLFGEVEGIAGFRRLFFSFHALVFTFLPLIPAQRSKWQDAFPRPFLTLFFSLSGTLKEMPSLFFFQV